MKKLLLIPIVLLSSCNCDSNKVEDKTYVVKVNYIYSSILTLPSDTIYITSRVEPHMYVDDGVSTLITDHIFNPHATNVRSFQILKVIE
jgi:hypothetical protein